MRNNLLKYFHDFNRTLDDEGCVLAYCGAMPQEVVVEMADMLQNILASEPEARNCARKVFKIFIESAQNILKYSQKREQLDNRAVGSGLIAVLKGDGAFHAQSGNRVSRAQAERIKRILNNISSLNREELNSHFKETLKQRHVLERNGSAGLGLVQIARSASQPLEWEFVKLDDDSLFFILQATIRTDE